MKYTLPHKFRNAIEIKDVSDFNCITDDMLSEFVDSLSKEKRFLVWADVDGEERECFNIKAMGLIERYQQRLEKLAKKIFSDDDLFWLELEPSNLYFE